MPVVEEYTCPVHDITSQLVFFATNFHRQNNRLVVAVKIKATGDPINGSPDWHHYHCSQCFFCRVVSQSDLYLSAVMYTCFAFKALESVITLNLDSLEKAVSTF